MALILDGPVESPILHCLTPVLGVLYCAAGSLLSYRRPLNRTGGLLIFGGIAWFASGLAATGIEPLIAVGQVLRTLPVVVTLHLLFVFPSGRTQSRLDRIGLLALYFAATVLYMPAYLFESQAAPYDVLFVGERPGFADSASLLRSAITWLVSIAIILNLLRRYRRANSVLRRAYRPFVGYSTLALVATPVAVHLATVFVDISPAAFSTIFAVALAGMPISMLIASHRGGFAPVSPLQELAGRLGEESWGEDLEATLAAAIGDPTLRIGFRMLDGELVTGSGEQLAARGSQPDALERRTQPDRAPGRWPSSPDRRECEIRFGDQSLGVISYDPSLVNAAEVRATASVAAAWIEQNRLSAALKVSEKELRSTYRQVMESADSERRRIAQDLHDGLASRLVLLAIKVQDVAPAGNADNGEIQRQVDELKSEIEQAIAELRSLVHDLMPPDLVELGLLPALQRLIDDAPLAGELRAPPALDSLPREVERSIYLIVAESVTNIVRHSRAESMFVALEQERRGAVISGIELVTSGDRDPAVTSGRIRLRISDDGIGGAVRGKGAGLSGIALRAASHEGEFELDSPPDGGTQLTVTLNFSPQRSSIQATESR